MPRNPGTGIYTKPFPDVISDTTIESVVHNGEIADIELDLNTPRPIVAGGTGATNAGDARTNLHTEVSMAEVTNYDMHVWEPGSFYSLSSATSPPIAGHSFHGEVYGTDQNNLVINARDYSDTAVPGRVYVREKKGGTWTGGWSLEGSSTYVELAGDTMTGNLTINKATPTISLSATAAADNNDIYAVTAGVIRWLTRMSNTDYNIYRFNDAGVLLDIPLSINRASGLTTATAGLAVGTTVSSALHPSTILGFCTSATNHGYNAYFGSDAVFHITAAGHAYITAVNPANGVLSWYTSNGFGAAGAPITHVEKMTLSPAGTLSMSGNINVGTGGSVVQLPLLVGTAPFASGYAMVVNSGANYAFAIRPSADGLQATTYMNAAGATVGSVTCSNTNTAFNTSSDASLKEDLKSFDAGNIIDNTNVYDFAWKSTGERAYGVIAQQAVEVYPTAVYHAEKDEKNARDEWWGIDYAKYIPVVLQELKTLRLRVAELEGRLEGKPP